MTQGGGHGCTYLVEQAGNLLGLHQLLSLQLLRLVLGLLLGQALNVRLNVVEADIHVGNDLLKGDDARRLVVHSPLQSALAKPNTGSKEGHHPYLVLLEVHSVQVRCLLLLKRWLCPLRLETRVRRDVLWRPNGTLVPISELLACQCHRHHPPPR